MNVVRSTTSADRRLWALLGTVLLVATGCGIDNDSAPRAVPDETRAPLVDPAQRPDSPVGVTNRVFLIAPETPNDSGHLRAVPRDVGDSATQRLTSLFGPLTNAETAARLRTSIPDGLQLHAASLRTDGVLTVDTSDQLLSLSGPGLIDAVAQIVFTASEVPGVQSVDLVVNGQRQPWPASDGELQTKPLTVYDYPGFVESTQPDFPAVPSPEG